MSKRKTHEYHIEIASYFENDAKEYLQRYDMCLYNDDPFQGKTWGVKLFVDLRMAYEAILKAILIRYSCGGKDRSVIYKYIEKFNHHIDKLSNAIKLESSIPRTIKTTISKTDNKLYIIPFGLRYSADTYDFIDSQEELFYSTIRDAEWRDKFHNQIKELLVVYKKETEVPIEDVFVAGKELDREEFRKRVEYKYSEIKDTKKK